MQLHMFIVSNTVLYFTINAPDSSVNLMSMSAIRFTECTCCNVHYKALIKMIAIAGLFIQYS